LSRIRKRSCSPGWQASQGGQGRGFRPAVHIDTHGSETHGIYIAGSKQFVSWQLLVDEFRKINLATENNLCVVSAACFAMNMIRPITINQQTPFYVMIAPQKTGTFSFVEGKTLPFYRAVFDGLDILRGYETHLAPEFAAFHCERLQATYLVDCKSCPPLRQLDQAKTERPTSRALLSPPP
jgi:hypothetical protein